MKEQNPNLKLLSVSGICLIGTLLIWRLTQNEQSASLGYLIWLGVIWVTCLVIANVIVWKEKIKVRSWNLIVLIFCTPIPFLFFFKLNSNEQVIGSEEYNKNQHRIKIVEYKNRKEYFTSVELTSEKNPFPLTENYKLDSIVYKDGSQTKILKNTTANSR